jgi:hypothetical protein
MASEEAAEDDHSGEKEADEEEPEEEEEEEEEEVAAILDQQFRRSNYVQNIHADDGDDDNKGTQAGWRLLNKSCLELAAEPSTAITGPTSHTNNATVVSSVFIRHKDPEVRNKMDVEKVVELARGYKLITNHGSDIAFMYGLLRHEVTEATKSKPRSIRQLDSSVFVPKISHMF